MPASPLIVAIQGELGSNSELAAREYFAEQAIDILPCYSFADMFAAVTDARADAAMAPVENSLAGSIHDVWDLLSQHDVHVSGEIRLRVVHCLIGLPGADLADVRRVRSHPQALAQCQEFLTSMHGVAVEAVYDTAGAVQMIKSENRLEEAAIASAQSAGDHDMQILAQDLSTADNFTRFLVLGQVAVVEQGVHGGGTQKTTVIADMSHTAAALPAVLGLLAARGIEVLKVETHKRAGKPWAYGVYLEFVGDAHGAAAEAIEQMHGFVDNLRVVGTYPAGIAAEPRLHPR